jgi:hypothetical protein
MARHLPAQRSNPEVAKQKEWIASSLPLRAMTEGKSVDSSRVKV